MSILAFVGSVFVFLASAYCRTASTTWRFQESYVLEMVVQNDPKGQQIVQVCTHKYYQILSNKYYVIIMLLFQTTSQPPSHDH